MAWLGQLLMARIGDIVRGFFQAFLPFIKEVLSAPDTGQVADTDPLLLDRLHDRVREHESDIRGNGVHRKDWTER